MNKEITPNPNQWNLLRNVNLFNWQKECLDLWIKNDCRGIAKVVTGAGKTILALAAIQKIQNETEKDLCVAIVVPTIMLMDQWYDEFVMRSNLPESLIGKLGEGRRDSYNSGKRIIICVLASARKFLPSMIEESGVEDKLLFIADECHRAGAPIMSHVLSSRRKYSIGISATPEREEGIEENDENDQLLERELGPIIYNYSLADGLKDGIVPPFMINHYGLLLDRLEESQYKALSSSISELRKELMGIVAQGRNFFAWVRTIAQQANSEYSGMASRFISETSKRKELIYGIKARLIATRRIILNELQVNANSRIILFHERISQVENICIFLQEAGISVVIEHSKLANSLRRENLNKFKSGEAKVIVSAKSLIEGFNVPAADVGIIVASSSSARQRIQSLGRVLRKHTSKGGIEKTSSIHIFYAKDTVDEEIYSNQDWDSVTGVDSNRYFIINSNGDQILQKGPPRSPLPKELEIDSQSLSDGSEYLGRLEGEEFSVDTNNNIRNGDSALAIETGELAKKIRKIKGTAGKFYVTPKRKYVLVRVMNNENWATLFVTRLSKDLDFNRDVTENQNDIINWLLEASAGDSYPFSTVTDSPAEISFSGKREGVIMKRVKKGKVFAKENSESQEVINRIKNLNNEGVEIHHLHINNHNHVLYMSEGKVYFIYALNEDIEFPD